jgi:hypothetical protein
MGSCISRKSRSCGHTSCCHCDSPHSRTIPNEINPATKCVIEDLIRSSVISSLQARNTLIRLGDSATLGAILVIFRAHAFPAAYINTHITPNPLRWSSRYTKSKFQSRILHRNLLCNEIKTGDYRTRLAWLRNLGILRYEVLGDGLRMGSEGYQVKSPRFFEDLNYY